MHHQAGPEVGRLQVVATPIGNLGDLTVRATEALKAADVICCEDTRHTRPLLQRIGATGARLLAVHAHNEREQAPAIGRLLDEGKAVCFVSDAGCPGVSDPGGRLVEAMVEAGHDVEVLPGASALTTALMGAGVDCARFAFLGFLPRKGGERERLVQGALQAGLGVVIYEAANRTEALLEDLHAWCGVRRVVVCRELTKLHETFHRGLLGGALLPPLVEKGEVVVVVEAGEAIAPTDVDVGVILADTEASPKERAKRLAKARGISVRDAYALVQAAKDDPAMLAELSTPAAIPSPKATVGDDTDVGDDPDDVPSLLAKAARLARQAAAALLAADDAARVIHGLGPDEGPAAGSDIEGADDLLRLLGRQAALHAPVEVKETATALLSTLSALDDLRDAVEDAASRVLPATSSHSTTSTAAPAPTPSTPSTGRTKSAASPAGEKKKAPVKRAPVKKK